jgi:hypothetical protein
LSSALIGGEWLASRPGYFTPEEGAPGAHWIEGWVGRRTGLEAMERRKILRLLGIELRSLGRPARSQSLYQLSYPGPRSSYRNHNNNLRGLMYLDTFRDFFIRSGRM